MLAILLFVVNYASFLTKDCMEVYLKLLIKFFLSFFLFHP